MAWLYCVGIIAIGIGLHTILKRWTVLGMCTLFVMINFPAVGVASSGSLPWHSPGGTLKPRRK
jgi:hypothetical protein